MIHEGGEDEGSDVVRRLIRMYDELGIRLCPAKDGLGTDPIFAIESRVIRDIYNLKVCMVMDIALEAGTFENRGSAFEITSRRCLYGYQ